MVTRSLALAHGVGISWSLSSMSSETPSHGIANNKSNNFLNVLLFAINCHGAKTLHSNNVYDGTWSFLCAGSLALAMIIVFPSHPTVASFKYSRAIAITGIFKIGKLSYLACQVILLVLIAENIFPLFETLIIICFFYNQCVWTSESGPHETQTLKFVLLEKLNGRVEGSSTSTSSNPGFSAEVGPWNLSCSSICCHSNPI